MRGFQRSAVAAAMLLSACGVADRSPTPSAELADLLDLTRAGDAVELTAVDTAGVWGTIALRRGPDTGGYPTDEIDPDSFIIEVSVTYTADRQPTTDFGRGDWAVVDADERLPVGGLFEPTMPANPADFDPDRFPLSTGPGAMEVRGEALWGRLYLQVPRDVADERLVLVYRPEGSQEIVSLLLRERAVAPPPVALATPVPRPEPGVYMALPNLPFTVLASAGADALFVEPDTCTNPVRGYTVAYPDDWYTNTAIGDTPACSWFSPTDYEVDEGDVPDEVAIVITVVDGAIGSFTQPDYLTQEQVDLSGFAGWRHEQVGVTYEGGGYEALPPSYAYSGILGDGQGEWPTFIASTDSQDTADYALHKAVLDRIMASLRFDR